MGRAQAPLNEIGPYLISVVGDGLCASVGQEDRVGSGGSRSVGVLVLGEVGSGVVVVNAILEGVWLGGLVFVSHRGRVAVSGSWKGTKTIIKCSDLLTVKSSNFSRYLSLKSAEFSTILCALYK